VRNSHHFPGFLIAIEGIDGAGKTTQANMVQSVLQARHLKVMRTKEPTTGPWGQVLRDSALTGRLSLEEEVDVFIKDRMEHVENTINPALKDGWIVIVDRYYFSNMAYQGSRGVLPEEIMHQNEVFAPEPDLLVLIDIDPKIGLERIRMRGDRANHFEETGTLEKARDIFLAIQKPYKYMLDGRDSADKTCDSIVRQFSRDYTEHIVKHGGTPQQKLNATLSLFGGDAI
jgi:dTMP kinase